MRSSEFVRGNQPIDNRHGYVGGRQQLHRTMPFCLNPFRQPRGEGINRAGKNLPARRKKTLMQAKQELREQFGRA